MRKIFLFFLVLLLSQEALIAQDTGEDAWRPDPGDLLIEVTGNPFNSSSFLALQFGQFRGRYFLTGSLVPRLGFQMNLDNDQPTPDVVTNVSHFRALPGIEYHPTNEGKFSSYAAFDLIVGSQSASRKSTTSATVLGSTQVPSSSTSSFSSSQRGFFELGVQLSAGADYYFNSRFYVGVEIGVQLISRKHDEIFVDGELFQESVTSKFGSVNQANAFRVGFLLF